MAFFYIRVDTSDQCGLSTTSQHSVNLSFWTSLLFTMISAILAAADHDFYKVNLLIVTVRSRYEFYHKPSVLLEFILSEVRTRDKIVLFYLCLKSLVLVPCALLR
jgi:hypothetical protein